MSVSASAAPVPVVDDALIARLRTDLLASGYTAEGVCARIGPVAAAALQREQTTPAILATDGGDRDPAAVLTRLFLLGLAVPRADIDAAVPLTGADGLIRLGLARVAPGPDRGDGAAVVAVLDLRPYAATDASGDIAWWIASDLGETETGKPLNPDHVLGVGGASQTLAQICVRPSWVTATPRVLDLGTGCGIQAMHAARDGAAVVATDVSARAIAFARFNAALAGIDAIEFRLGSMFEPVAGETFDLVISNPPFVITPRGGALAEYEYRDAGRSGDDLVAELVSSVATVLAPGGVGQFLANWEHRSAAAWHDRVAGWLEPTGLNAWVIQREVLDPAQYAETWLRDGGMTQDRDAAGWRRGYAAWLADFAERDVVGVGLGYVMVWADAAGPGRGPWRRIEHYDAPVQLPLGGAIERTIAAARAYGAAEDDAAVLATRWVVAADVTEERSYLPGAEDPSVIVLRQGAGLRRGVQVSSEVAAVVGACDGQLRLDQLIEAVCAIIGEPADAVTARTVPVLRDLVLGGMLTAL